ncbi:hypothetical protein NC652_037225 [Populus alba x Populus x berolinensis]|nr:hypothetical protein NC652_037225 [Populus alba x Populus x berolinensis]
MSLTQKIAVRLWRATLFMIKVMTFQFIGVTRNIGGQRFLSPENPCFAGAMSLRCLSRALIKRSLTEARKSWMEEYVKTTGKVPPGNEIGNALGFDNHQ